MGFDVAGKTGTAQVISNQGKAAARRNDQRPARQRLVRVLRAARQPGDRRRRVPRARRPRLERRADCASPDRHVLRQEGRAAAAAAADARHRLFPTAQANAGASWTNELVFERRLYYHIDWALLIAILALCAIGVVMIYSTTSDPTRAASHMTCHADLRDRARPRRDARDADPRLPDVHRQIASHLHRPPGPARLRAVLRHRADGRAALDRAGALQPPAVGIRQGRRRPGARQVLRREPRHA